MTYSSKLANTLRVLFTSTRWTQWVALEGTYVRTIKREYKREKGVSNVPIRSVEMCAESHTLGMQIISVYVLDYVRKS